jgi:hypothetical protein
MHPRSSHRAFLAALTALTASAYGQNAPIAPPQVPTPAVPKLDTRQVAEEHAATKVVAKYLRASIQRNFEAAATMVDPDSLTGLHQDYVRRLRSAKLMADEEKMCRAVGVGKVEEVAAMDPVVFYVRYNQDMQRRYQITDEVNKRMASTLDIAVLGLAVESASLVHLVVRTKHHTMDNAIDNLETVSVTAKTGTWMISLSEKMPKIRPLVPAAPTK